MLCQVTCLPASLENLANCKADHNADLRQILDVDDAAAHLHQDWIDRRQAITVLSCAGLQVEAELRGAAQTFKAKRSRMTSQPTAVEMRTRLLAVRQVASCC